MALPKPNAVGKGNDLPPEVYDIFESAARNYVAGVESALSSGVDIDAEHPDTGMTALHYAAGHFAESTLEYLLAKRANPNLLDHAGRTPIMVMNAMAPGKAHRAKDSLWDAVAKYNEPLGLVRE